MDRLRDDGAIIDGVLSEFLPLCAIPHPSRREKAITDYLARLLRDRGWTVERDKSHNLKADLPGTPEREHAPLTAIQGHTDMVCAVLQGSGWDPERDPVTAVLDGDILRTDGRSSLGADCNLGNAAVLWLLTRDIPHGPLRLLLTSAEEVGLEGASKVDPDWLAGVRYLINTDGFKLGDLIVSSSGGRRETFTRPLDTVPRTKTTARRIRFRGFLGGHSGYDIHLGRGNPIRLMAQLLGELGARTDYELADLSGGHGHNAIPMDCTAVVVLDETALPALEQAAEGMNRGLAALYGRKDPNGRVELEKAELPPRVWSPACRDDTLDLLCLLVNGVFAMHDTIPDKVSASSNLGMVSAEDGTVTVRVFLRCAERFSEELLSGQHARAARRCGFARSAVGYPGWPGSADNPLARRMADIYLRLTGERANITAVHVGLELSVLGAKNPDMVMVNTGPDIFDPHSTDERARLSSLPPYVRLLAATLAELSETPNIRE